MNANHEAANRARLSQKEGQNQVLLTMGHGRETVPEVSEDRPKMRFFFFLK